MVDTIRNRISAWVDDTPWLNHLVRAGGRYNRQRGDYYAAGITYFTMLAAFPLLMVAYSVAAFVLSRNPQVLHKAHDEILSHVPGAMGRQIGDLLDRAVNARTTVGVLGLLGGVYAGTGWVANLRAALTEQWEQRHTRLSWWREKLSDLAALFGLLLALAVSVGLTTLRSPSLGHWILHRLHISDSGVTAALLAFTSLALGLVASWALFTWIIARMPREPVTLTSAMRAGVLAAVVFEAFKLAAGWYLARVLRSPASAVFGPVIGVMVFAYFTYRILLFATAWAATAHENMELVESDRESADADSQPADSQPADSQPADSQPADSRRGD